MKSLPASPNLPRQRGMTLIEILVAMVLLSIGLLGLAGLQLRGMQVNQGSAVRSQAAIVAEDLADRMRAEALLAKPGNAAGSFYGTYTPANAGAASPAAMQDWLQASLSQLPAGVDSTGAVPCAGQQLPCVRVAAVGATVPAPIQIDVWWNDTRAATAATKGAPATPGKYTMVAALSNQF